MSYILDALKKAEAERSLGEVPGIHAQPFQPLPAESGATRMKSPWLWVALACLALMIAAAAWYWASHRASSNTQAPPLAPSAVRMPAVAQAPAPAPAVTPPPAPVKEPPSPKTEPKKEPEKPSRPHKQSRRASAADHPAPAVQPVAAPALRELPLALQREIPPLDIGGYIYSKSAADRSVLINQHLLKEGEQVAAGLTLEEIRADGVVLDYRGHRFRQSY